MGLACALMLAQVGHCPAAARAADTAGLIDAQLRCQWVSPDVRYWNVRLSVVDPKSETASISEVENHSASEATSGAFELSSDKRTLSVQPRHAMHGGALQIRVHASAEAKLRIEVSANTRHEPQAGRGPRVKEILLSEIIDGRTIQSDPLTNDESADVPKQPSWSVTRIAGDGLRIENIRDVPIYEPGSQLRFAVRANSFVAQASRALTLEYSLYRVHDGETVSSRDWPIRVDSRGVSQPIEIDEPLPQLPGVYEVRCQLSRQEGNLWSRLRRSEPPVIRQTQPIVIASTKDQIASAKDQSRADETKPWRNAGAIRPSESTWSVGQWLPKQTPRFISGANLPKANNQSESQIATSNNAGESISLLPPRSTFQATLPVNTPGLPHKVTIRYPAARSFALQVDVGGPDDRSRPAVSFVLASDAEIGENEPWKTHTFVHYPKGGDQIWLTNLSSTAAAAFESVGVVAGPSRLASRSEPTGKSRAVMVGLGSVDWVDSLARDVSTTDSLATCDPDTILLYKLWVASNRLSDYALVNGMNGILVPANTGARCWFDSSLFYACRNGSAQEARRLATFMQLMNRYSLDVVVGLQPGMLLCDPERAVRERPSISAQLIRSHHDGSGQYNPLSPLVRETVAALVHEIYQQCDDYECFAGIALRCDAQSHLEPLLEATGDQGTLALFAQSKGATVGPANLLTWVQQQGKLVFETWLHDETRSAYRMVGESCPDRPLLMVMPRDAVSNGRDQAHSARIELFAQPHEPTSLVPAESFFDGSASLLANKAKFQQQLAAISAHASETAGAANGSLAAILGDGIDESNEPVVAGDQLIADISRIVDRLDPATVVIGWPMFADRLHDPLAMTLRGYAATPVVNAQRVDPTDPALQTIHVASRTNEGHLYVSMISLAPWASEVELDTSAPVDWVLLGDDGGPGEATSILDSEGTHARVVVPAGRLITVKSAAATSANLKFWSARVHGGSAAVEQIKHQVTLILERIGILSDFETYDALKNGGFERSGEMGLVGWLHAQHPPGCVRTDDKEFVEGKHSVLLTTDGVSANRTWLVSDTIKPPRSGRLAVSFVCRGELKDDDSSHLLRVSIEATRNGVPIRYANEIKVPRNGQWGSREVVLEADGIEVANVDSLRLTIDSLSRGRVWIDDVHLHDRFPTAKERTELESQAFNAVKGLQKGNLTPSGRLLQNHWARHLLAHTPRQAKQETKSADQQQEQPGVAKRILNWLPLRF
jgi:hypothetical protein